jgi:hypothetical protein
MENDMVLTNWINSAKSKYSPKSRNPVGKSTNINNESGYYRNNYNNVAYQILNKKYLQSAFHSTLSVPTDITKYITQIMFKITMKHLLNECDLILSQIDNQTIVQSMLAYIITDYDFVNAILLLCEDGFREDVGFAKKYFIQETKY